MNSLERRSVIAQRLSSRHTVDVAELARELGVSGMTVRRDLTELERQGVARRIHGGAVRDTQRSFEPPLVARSTHRVAEKRRMCRAALALVKAGDSIAIDIGSTTLFFAEALREAEDLRLIILTPSLKIAAELSEHPSYTVIVSGGVVRRGEGSLTGEVAADFFQRYNVDKLFISVAGISALSGLTEFNIDDAAVKRAMIRSAKQVIALADGSKFERVALCGVSGIETVSVLVTDEAPQSPLRDALEAHGTRILVA